MRNLDAALVAEQTGGRQEEEAPRRSRRSKLFFAEAPETSIAQAEEDALAQTAEHAGLADGQHILELGCGWGSLSLYMAARYPAARITAVSNSRSQRQHIEKLAAATHPIALGEMLDPDVKTNIGYRSRWSESG